MTKQILQIEYTNNEDFKNEILVGVKDILFDFKKENKHIDRLFTREETAKRLSISLVTLWKLTKNNVIPAYRIGTSVRYKESDIIALPKKMNQFD
ncbi:helix-turn-helix domain-containing protein [Olleya sp.]|jgi:excisionase family DNA binding protein|uniref:helix-turn-helix domain-containing protein n=1 Tax=Olleya sp. TaxID=1906788 RepID=UPI000C15CD52|nr:hypothetical protein BFP78_14495 [Gaetbulibacter sp. 5U11]